MDIQCVCSIVTCVWSMTSSFSVSTLTMTESTWLYISVKEMEKTLLIMDIQCVSSAMYITMTMIICTNISEKITFTVIFVIDLLTKPVEMKVPKTHIIGIMKC